MKNILITGSTDGIGKLTAIQLAKEGHHIYLHGRNPDKLNFFISEIKDISNNENIYGFIADFSDLNAVRLMAEQVKSKLSKIDVLINNAGILKNSISTGTNTIDIHFLINYLAPYLLTNLLLPLIKKSKEPRVINLSSAAQLPVSHHALEGKETLDHFNAYAQSKLALTMWNSHLANIEPNLIAIAVNPGSYLNTKMTSEANMQYQSSANKGANILYELATSKAYTSDSGKYFNNDLGSSKGSFSTAHPDAYDTTKMNALMDLTHNLVTPFFPK